MNCSSCQPLLIDRLLGDLAPEQADDVALHVATCDACRREAADLERDFSLLSETVAPDPPPASLKTTVLASLHAQPEARLAAPPMKSAKRRMSEAPQSVPFVRSQTANAPVKRLIAAALVGVAVGGLVTYALQSTLSKQAAEDAATQSLAKANQELAAAMQAGRRLTPNAVLRTASFRSERRPEMVALLTWDVPSSQIHFHAVGLSPPPAGKVYRLWLIDDNDQWVPVGKLSLVPPNSAAPTAEAGGQTAYQLLAAPPQSDRPFHTTALTIDDAANDDSTDNTEPSRKPGKVVARSKFLVSTPELPAAPPHSSNSSE